MAVLDAELAIISPVHYWLYIEDPSESSPGELLYQAHVYFPYQVSKGPRHLLTDPVADCTRVLDDPFGIEVRAMGGVKLHINYYSLGEKAELALRDV